MQLKQGQHNFESASLDLPREKAKDVYLSVRLEAGALHLANYLIRIAANFLLKRWEVFSDLQNIGAADVPRLGWNGTDCLLAGKEAPRGASFFFASLRTLPPFSAFPLRGNLSPVGPPFSRSRGGRPLEPPSKHNLLCQHLVEHYEGSCLGQKHQYSD